MAARPGRQRLLFQTAYACGLRCQELLGLQCTDIDSARMVICVREGKGRKQRLVPLSIGLLEEMRGYWRRFRPQPWLFPGICPDRPLTDGSLHRLCQQVVARAGLKRRVTMHTLRHSCATHLMEAGVDVVIRLDGISRGGDVVAVQAVMCPAIFSHHAVNSVLSFFQLATPTAKTTPLYELHSSRRTNSG
jgi:integrase